MPAVNIAKALDGHRAGRGWIARCPAHDDRHPSLSIADTKDGKVLVRCHAGCDQERIIAALRGRGLWAENGPRCLSHLPRCRTPVERKPNQDDARRSEIALAIWQSARPAQRTPAETYLASRGIYLQPTNALRFHACLKHPSGDIWPAMLALVNHGFAAERVPLSGSARGRFSGDIALPTLGIDHAIEVKCRTNGLRPLYAALETASLFDRARRPTRAPGHPAARSCCRNREGCRVHGTALDLLAGTEGGS